MSHLQCRHFCSPFGGRESLTRPVTSSVYYLSSCLSVYGPPTHVYSYDKICYTSLNCLSQVKQDVSSRFLVGNQRWNFFCRHTWSEPPVRCNTFQKDPSDPRKVGKVTPMDRVPPMLRGFIVSNLRLLSGRRRFRRLQRYPRQWRTRRTQVTIHWVTGVVSSLTLWEPNSSLESRDSGRGLRWTHSRGISGPL